MKCVASHKSDLQETFTNIRSLSYEEKTSTIIEEEKINTLLDVILDFKSDLKEKTSKIYNINERLEKITWYSDLDNDNMMILNDIISLAKDLRSSLIRKYVSMNTLRQKGIAKEEIKEFKNSIDELKESYEDLESVFFYLPEMPEFIETTKKLSLVS